MSRPKPINEAAAVAQLLEEYERVAGNAPNDAVTMICEASASRAMEQDWEWVKDDNPNWPMRLEWK